MMRHIETGEGQTAIDIAMQHCGDVSLLFDLCLLNDISLTGDIAPLETLALPEFGPDAGKIVKLFANTGLIPASYFNVEDEVLEVDSVRDFDLIIQDEAETDVARVNDMQAFIDFAIQDLADVERVFELCLLNDLPLTELLVQGSIINLPVVEPGKERQVAYFKNRVIISRDEEDENGGIQLPPGGIGFMQIESTFIVS